MIGKCSNIPLYLLSNIIGKCSHIPDDLLITETDESKYLQSVLLPAVLGSILGVMLLLLTILLTILICLRCCPFLLRSGAAKARQAKETEVVDEEPIFHRDPRMTRPLQRLHWYPALESLRTLPLPAEQPTQPLRAVPRPSPPMQRDFLPDRGPARQQMPVVSIHHVNTRVFLSKDFCRMAFIRTIIHLTSWSRWQFREVMNGATSSV